MARGDVRRRAQVLVVGGGPVGLLVAAELAGYGVDTVLLEARAEVSERPRATTLHARAVQSLARRGHLPGAEHGYTAPAAGSPFHFAGLPGLVIEVPAREPEAILKCPQAELERHFEQRATAAGARILREHRVTGFVREDGPGGGVRVTVQGPRGSDVWSAAHLVGADGSRSTVREQADIASEEHPATVSALMGTVVLDPPDALADGWHRTPRGWVVAKRTPDGRTHLRTLDCTGACPDRRRQPTLEELRREVCRITGRDLAMRSPQWLSRFSDFARLATAYRAGRVLLVGDAAHVHFPIGGQGLSTGVLDALNLGWKLALVARGGAAEGLLDTYDLERRPVARRVIDHTRAQLALMRPGPELDALRRVFTDLLAAEGVRDRLGGLISAQDTVLPAPPGASAPAVGTFLPNVVLDAEEGRTDVIGLLREGRALLLHFGAEGARHREAARPWEAPLGLRVVGARPVAQLPYEALLVRPDGYLAWVPGAGDLDRVLSGYFARPALVGPAV